MHHRTGEPFSARAAVHLQLKHRGDPSISAGYCPILTECDSDYDVMQQVYTTFPACRINKVMQVNHRQMYGMYLLRLEEMKQRYRGSKTKVKELRLYHVTTETRGVQSLENGLDWRRTWRSKFGCGVSFSDDADYADFWADNSSKEDKRVIIICTVAVAKMWKVLQYNSGYNMLVPPGTADTTCSPNGRVFVKYNDYDFCPLYMVYYRRRTDDDLKLSRYFIEKNANGANKPQHQQQQQQQQQQLQQQRILQQNVWEEQQREKEKKLREDRVRRQRWEEQQREDRVRRQRWEEQQCENERLWYEEEERRQHLEKERRRQKESNSCLIL